MQGKGLVPVAIAVALLLAGCGGGGATPSGESTKATRPGEAMEQLKVRAVHLQEERQADAGGTGREEGSNGKPFPHFDPHPAYGGHDSGGGTAQFVTKTGDNSIQESGREAGTAERAEAAAVLHAYLDARVAPRLQEACFYISASLVATMEGFAERYAKNKKLQGCPEVLAAFAPGASQGASAQSAAVDVGSLRVENDHGFVLYHGPGGAPFAMPMVREGGAWKVGSLEGTPLK